MRFKEINNDLKIKKIEFWFFFFFLKTVLFSLTSPSAPLFNNLLFTPFTEFGLLNYQNKPNKNSKFLRSAVE